MSEYLSEPLRTLTNWPEALVRLHQAKLSAFGKRTVKDWRVHCFDQRYLSDLPYREATQVLDANWNQRLDLLPLSLSSWRVGVRVPARYLSRLPG